MQILPVPEYFLVLSCALFVHVRLSYKLAGQVERWRWWTALGIISLMVVTPLTIFALKISLILSFALFVYVELSYKSVVRAERLVWWVALGIINLVVVPLVLKLEQLTLVGTLLVGETFMRQHLGTALALLVWLIGISLSVAIAALSTTWGLRQLAAPLYLNLPQHLGRSIVFAASISVFIDYILIFAVLNWRYLWG